MAKESKKENNLQKETMLYIGEALLRKRIFGDIYHFDSPLSGVIEFRVNKIKNRELVDEISGALQGGEKLRGEIKEIIEQIIMKHIDNKVSGIF